MKLCNHCLYSNNSPDRLLIQLLHLFEDISEKVVNGKCVQVSGMLDVQNAKEIDEWLKMIKKFKIISLATESFHICQFTSSPNCWIPTLSVYGGSNIRYPCISISIRVSINSGYLGLTNFQTHSIEIFAQFVFLKLAQSGIRTRKS